MKKLKIRLIWATVILGLITILLNGVKEYSWADAARTCTGVGCVCCLFAMFIASIEEQKEEDRKGLFEDEEYED